MAGGVGQSGRDGSAKQRWMEEDSLGEWEVGKSETTFLRGGHSGDA